MQELKAAFDVRFIKPHIHTHASTSPAAHTCSGLRAQSAARESRPQGPGRIFDPGLTLPCACIPPAVHPSRCPFAPHTVPFQYGDPLTEEQVMELVKETDVLNEVRCRCCSC